MKRSIRKLKKELSESSDNSFMACKCNEISRWYMYRDLDQVHHYGTLALKHAQEDENTFETARAYLNLGACNFLRQDFEEGVYYYNLAHNLSQDDPLTFTRIFMGIGFCFSLINCHREAVIYGEKALQVAIKEGLLNEKAAIYHNIGRVYSDLGDYELSNNYFSRGYQIAIEESLYGMQGYLLVGLIQNDLKFSELAPIESNLLKLETLIDQHNEMWYMGISQCLWGCYYAASDTIGCAKEHFTTGIEILEEENQDYNLTLAYLSYADTLCKISELYEAKLIFDQYESFLKRKNIKIALPKYYASLADFYAMQSDVKYYNKYNQQYMQEKEIFESMLKEHF